MGSLYKTGHQYLSNKKERGKEKSSDIDDRQKARTTTTVSYISGLTASYKSCFFFRNSLKAYSIVPHYQKRTLHKYVYYISSQRILREKKLNISVLGLYRCSEMLEGNICRQYQYSIKVN